MTPEDLVNHVLAERRAALEEARREELLDTQALVDRGNAIAGLTVAAAAGKEVVLHCPPHVSRIRPGDRLELSSGDRLARGTLLDVRDHGRELVLRVEGRGVPADGTWTARLQPVDLSSLTLRSLAKLQAGGPGWAFFNMLASGAAPWQREPPPDAEAAALLDAIAAEAPFALDEAQRSVLDACLRQPPALAVQGPPGTGKTVLLAFVAEALSRQGRRVVLTAPTHQAVNNALSTVHALFPGRQVLKVGDALRREALHEDIPVSIVRDATRGGLRLAHESITGMTLLSALAQLVLRGAPLAPNVLIVDEAGQLPLAQGACAGLTGAGSILLFGDDMQMPPVFTEAVAGDPCAVSVFSRFREHHPELVPLLPVTYRLNRGLCDAIGGTFYGARLQPSASAADRRLDPGCAAAAGTADLARILAPDAPLVWVPSDTAGCTQHNAAEARLVAEVLSAAIRGGLDVGDVAAVTPFRRQAMAIRNELQARLPGASELPIVDTVERVQGQTVELVAISACASDRAYLREIGGFILSPNRLNVAASRARTKVVLTAHPAVMREIPSEYDAVLAQRAWRRLVEMATVVPLPAWEP